MHISRIATIASLLWLVPLGAVASDTTDKATITRLVVTESSLDVNIFLDVEAYPDPAACAGGAGPTRVRLSESLVSYQQLYDGLLAALYERKEVRVMLDSENCEDGFPSVVGLVLLP